MSVPTQRVFVTGGRGRLASLVADYLRAPTFEVTLFSRTAGPGLHAAAELGRPGRLTTADFLLHLAWSTLPASAQVRPGDAAEDDLREIDRLLDALAAQRERRRTQFVFFSSGGAVYGQAPGRPSREDDACHPIGRYGQAKLAAEQRIITRAQEHDIPCTILRISNPYGYPVPKNRQQGLIPHALRCAMEGQPLSIWGDGSARKDFLYYTDFLAALEAVLAGKLTGTYNISAGESHSVIETVRLVENETGRPVALAFGPAPEWDVQDSRLDNSRLADATGWRPRVNLAEGIQRAAAGYTQI